MGLDRPGLLERLRARIVTGPLGHLYGGLLDWAQLAGRWALARARGRDPWA
ncbi:MAG: hypothetical protein MUC84_12235 [Solirubrobacteraceae bacterium]|jgi:hypothetical protein|nr:hypothetical protein [Solirubrobacteraceae bacterium]MCU0314814.1 hypothetical protein [Solirubrobacteraceae bacterium]